MMKFRTSTREIDLSQQKPLGEGGAGIVYPMPGKPDLCVKIYRRDANGDHARDHAEKVKAMVARPPDKVMAPDGKTVQMAWPKEVVTDESGTFRGFVMPVIDMKAARAMPRVLNPKLRRQHNIPDSLLFRLTAATNLAILMESLHSVGHNIIDLKPQNILAYLTPKSRTGFLALLDCDGFSIEGARGKRYPAALATPEFAHPQGLRPDGGIDLDWMNAHGREQDLWSLGILIFLFLNEMHPLQGVPEDGFRDFPTELPLLARRHKEVYAYGVKPNPRVRPRANSLHEWFDPRLRNLFDRTFSGDYGALPSAREWSDVLKDLMSTKRACRKNHDHWRLGDECGQCALEKRLGPPPAPPPAPTQVAMPVNLPPPPKQPRQPKRQAPPPTGFPGFTGPKPLSLSWAWTLGLFFCALMGVGAGAAIFLLRDGLLAGWTAQPALVTVIILWGLAFLLARVAVRRRARRRGRPLLPANRLWALLTLVAGLGLLPVTAIHSHDQFARNFTPSVADTPIPSTKPAAEPRATMAQIRAVQTELSRLQLYNGGADGRVGPKTREAVASFARGQGIAMPDLQKPEDVDALITRLKRQPTPVPAPLPTTPPPAAAPAEPAPVPAATIGLEAALNRSIGLPMQALAWEQDGRSGFITNLGPITGRDGCYMTELVSGDINRTRIACRSGNGEWRFD